MGTDISIVVSGRRWPSWASAVALREGKKEGVARGGKAMEKEREGGRGGGS